LTLIGSPQDRAGISKNPCSSTTSGGCVARSGPTATGTCQLRGGKVEAPGRAGAITKRSCRSVSR